MPGAESVVRSLCDRFGYPEPLEAALEGACERLARFSPRAILLVGSASRGEMTFRWREDGRLELLSDIELICIADRAAASEIRQSLDAFTATLTGDGPIVPNGLFHLDCLVTPKVRAGPEARGLFWYEASRSHALLHGPNGSYFGDEDAPVSLPLVAQLALVRLFWMGVQLPATVLRDPPGALEEGEREMFLYSQLRNILDVLSIWLPHEGILACGYRDRLARLESKWEKLRGRGHFAPGFRAAVAEATRRKLSCELEGDPFEWYLTTLGAYEGLISFLAGLPHGLEERELLERLPAAWSARHRPPVSFRFRGFAALRRLRIAARRSAGIRWLVRPGLPDADALTFLLALHQSARARLEGDPARAVRRLDDARTAMWRFSGVRLPAIAARTGFAGAWHETRRAAIPELLHYFRKLRGHRSTIEKAMLKEDRRLG